MLGTVQEPCGPGKRAAARGWALLVRLSLSWPCWPRMRCLPRLPRFVPRQWMNGACLQGWGSPMPPLHQGRRGPWESDGRPPGPHSRLLCCCIAVSSVLSTWPHGCGRHTHRCPTGKAGRCLPWTAAGLHHGFRWTLNPGLGWGRSRWTD